MVARLKAVVLLEAACVVDPVKQVVAKL